MRSVGHFRIGQVLIENPIRLFVAAAVLRVAVTYAKIIFGIHNILLICSMFSCILFGKTNETVKKMTIPDEIRVLCAKLHISVAELARQLGCSPQSLSEKMSRMSFTIEDLEETARATNTKFVRKFVLLNGEEV
ncbi:MAG: helix-turn-helix transcriptional regulator [Christensenellaceae bacterium]|jgi:uncharacterized membrane protein YraQ (UPF0718 family)|nr:helix-turn-helix transcriptional regulator [Christensenellaceae bacterium]